MANPGTGYRTVNSVLCEVSSHLLEPLANTTFTNNTFIGNVEVDVVSCEGIYVGAQLVVGINTPHQEIVTVTVVFPEPPDPAFEAIFTKTHSAGDAIITATFPTQQPTDPFFTQAEMLSYISRAQNEFLSRVPCIFSLFTQTVSPNEIFQSTPSTAIEINRVAASILPSPLAYLRLYERTLEQITALNRNWRQVNQTQLTQWFEDRSGNYQWGVGGNPTPAGGDFPVELLCSIRDTDSLALTDGFLIPDILTYILKYKVLEYAWTKDGQQQNLSLAKYCADRFERGVLATTRWLNGVMDRPNPPKSRGSR